jgi:hypothetical protein
MAKKAKRRRQRYNPPRHEAVWMLIADGHSCPICDLLYGIPGSYTGIYQDVLSPRNEEGPPAQTEGPSDTRPE